MMQRYTNIDLPFYKYVPKQGVHPSKMKDVIHIPEIEESWGTFSAKNWNNSTRYLYAIDLFNLGFYWEVHEVLEKLWLVLGKRSVEGTFVQGLIQLSVALLKHLQGNRAGAERLIFKALPRIQSKQGTYLGIDIEKLVVYSLEYLEGKKSNMPQIILK